MDQKTSGIYRLTQISRVYSGFQDLLGADRSRRTLVAKYIRPRCGDRVLDIGCGPASMLPYLGPVDYVGVDLNPDHIEAARKRFGGSAELHCADLYSIPSLATRCFDIVLCAGLLHHLDDGDAARLLSFASNRIAPRGRLISVDPAFTPGQHWVARWFARSDSGQHVRSPEQYRRLAEGAFAAVEQNVRHDLLRFPYTHCIQQAYHRPSA